MTFYEGLKLTDTELKMLIDALSEAAVDIEECGWRRGGARMKEDMDPHGTNDRCLWIGACRAIERQTTDIRQQSVLLEAAENAILSHFDMTLMTSLFAMNDHFPGPDEEGQAWAAENLRSVATQLKDSARAKALVEGPVTGSIE